jgi:hypothetical protein
MLQAKNPFNEQENLFVCPECLTLENTVYTACDEPGCNQAASSGTPTPNGYRNTCHDHYPFKGVKV